MILPMRSSGLVRVSGLSVALRRADPKSSVIIRAAVFCCDIEQWFSRWTKSGYLIHLKKKITARMYQIAIHHELFIKRLNDGQ